MLKVIDMNGKYNIEPFQVFDVLSQTDFEKVLIEKTNFIKPEPGAGSTIYFNGNYNESKIGIFSTLCDTIKSILLSKNLLDPRVISLDFLSQTNRTKMKFHKHIFSPDIDPYKEHSPVYDPKNLFSVPYEFFWVAVYYPHNVYDKRYQGELTVKLSEDDKGKTFEAVPNSIVFHNANYGHSVFMQQTSPNYVRDSCFTHWLCKKSG